MIESFKKILFFICCSNTIILGGNTLANINLLTFLPLNIVVIYQFQHYYLFFDDNKMIQLIGRLRMLLKDPGWNVTKKKI